MAIMPTAEQTAAFNKALADAWPAWWARNRERLLAVAWGPCTDLNELRRADREAANRNEPRVRMVDGVKVMDLVPSKAPPEVAPAPRPDPWKARLETDS